MRGSRKANSTAEAESYENPGDEREPAPASDDSSASAVPAGDGRAGARRRASSTASCRCSSSTAACWRRRRTRRVPLLERLRFLTICQHQPRRVLRDPRRGPASSRSTLGVTRRRARRPRRRRRCSRSVARGAHALVDGAVPRAERGAAARAREPRASASCARDEWTRAQARWVAALLHARGAAGADADRPRSGASVPARPQQEPELRRRARGQGRVRPHQRRRDRAGAARRCRASIRLPQEVAGGAERLRVPVRRCCTRTSTSSSPA